MEASREMTASLGNDAPSLGVAMFLLFCSAAMLVCFSSSARADPSRSAPHGAAASMARQEETKRAAGRGMRRERPAEAQRRRRSLFRRARSLSLQWHLLPPKREGSLSLCSVASRRATQAHGRPFFLPSARSHDDASSCACMTGTSLPFPSRFPRSSPNYADHFQRSYGLFSPFPRTFPARHHVW